MFVPFLRSAVGALWRERLYDGPRWRQVRDARIAALLSHARDTTPLYRDRIRSTDPGALIEVPSITKAELMERFDDSISGGLLTRDEVEAYTKDPRQVGRLFRSRFMLATTSGTTGHVGYFVTDRRAWAELNGALLARILRHRLIPREIIRFCWGRRYRMAMAVATEGHFITRLVATFKPIVSRLLVNMQAFSIVRPKEETIASLNRFRPHYLHSYPTYLELLAHEQLAGRLRIDPEFVSLGSEPVSRLAREVIARAFPNAEVSETYGATECLAIANQCRFQSLHVNEDYCVLEPVDAAGRPVPPGVPSAKVLLTNLVNRAQPLLRYELSDSVTIVDEPCSCGSPMPRIRVEGRSDDTFYLEDAGGRLTPHPPVPFEVLFLNVDGLLQYQLVHEEQNRLMVRYVVGEGDPEEVRRVLAERFDDYLARNLLSGCVTVRLERVDRIDREAQGHKLRQIYSRVPRPPIR